MMTPLLHTGDVSMNLFIDVLLQRKIDIRVIFLIDCNMNMSFEMYVMNHTLIKL